MYDHLLRVQRDVVARECGRGTNLSRWYGAARHPDQAASQMLALCRKRLPAFLLCGVRERRLSACFLRLPGFPQGAKTFHVLANRNGLLLEIQHRSRSFFQCQTTPVGPRDAFGRELNCFLSGHLPIQIWYTQSPLDPRIERACDHLSTSVRWRTTQASDRFSALTLPLILSVLSSKVTF